MTDHRDSKPYWELHLTFADDKADVEKFVRDIGWKFSAIDGDPVLGEGVKCYGTLHLNKRLPLGNATDVVLAAAEQACRHGLNVIRAKVESVDFDRRYSTT